MKNIDDLFFDKIERLEKQEQYGAVVELYTQAINQNMGDKSTLHAKKARALNRLKRWEEAIKECQIALDLDAKHHLAHRILGYTYLMQAKYDLAEKHFLAALDSKADDSIALANLGCVYHAQAKYNLAEENTIKAMHLEPDNTTYLYNLIISYLNDETKQPVETIELLEKYVQLRPDDFRMRLALADLYINESKFSQAITQLNAAFKTKPTEWRIYLLYLILMLKYPSRNNIGGLVIYFGWLGVMLGVPIFAPTSVSITVGILLAVIFAPPLFLQRKGNAKAILFLLMSYAGYWYLVFIHWGYHRIAH